MSKQEFKLENRSAICESSRRILSLFQQELDLFLAGVSPDGESEYRHNAGRSQSETHEELLPQSRAR